LVICSYGATIDVRCPLLAKQ